jgi:hypothetical protein
LFGSVCVSTQAPEHTLLGAVQVALQLPLSQYFVAIGHAIAHAPQLFESCCRFAQMFPHRTSGGVHGEPASDTPPSPAPRQSPPGIVTVPMFMQLDGMLQSPALGGIVTRWLLAPTLRVTDKVCGPSTQKAPLAPMLSNELIPSTPVARTQLPPHVPVLAIVPVTHAVW